MRVFKLFAHHLLVCSSLVLVMLTNDVSASNVKYREDHKNEADEKNWESPRKEKKVKAIADIRACNSGDDIRGKAYLKEKLSDQGVKKVRVKVVLQGWDIPDGEHGLHIHEVANCDPCGDAGGHFDPGPNSNSSPDGNHPFHLGDLVNIEVDNGYGQLKTTTTRVTLSDGPISIFDENGSAFIVHVNADTFCPDGEEAGCAGGGRLACGIIERVK